MHPGHRLVALDRGDPPGYRPDGYESTTIPTIVRDAYGNVNVSGVYPNIVMPFGVSNVQRPPARSTIAEDAPATDKPHWKISEIT